MTDKPSTAEQFAAFFAGLIADRDRESFHLTSPDEAKPNADTEENNQ